MGDCRQTDEPSRYLTNNKVNSAFYPSGVGKSSTGLYGTTVGVEAEQVTLRSSVMGFLLRAVHRLYLFTFILLSLSLICALVLVTCRWFRVFGVKIKHLHCMAACDGASLNMIGYYLQHCRLI